MPMLIVAHSKLQYQTNEEEYHREHVHTFILTDVTTKSQPSYVTLAEDYKKQQ